MGILKTITVYGALMLTATIYGGWALVAKTALQDGADPMVFAFYRCLGGTAVLVSAMQIMPSLRCSKGTGLLEKVQRIPQHDLLRFAMLGTFMAAIICGFLLATSKLSALTVATFQPTIPVFAMIFSIIFGVEQITKYKFAGVMSMVAGAMCVAAFGETAQVGGATDHTSVVIGMLFVVMQTSAAGMFFVHNKEIVKTYEPVFATAMTYLVSSVMIFLAAVLKVGFDSNKWIFGTRACLGLMYAVGLTTAFNYSVLAWANKQSTPIITASSTTIQPIAAATLSLIFLGIGFSNGQLVGALLIASGLLVTMRGQFLESVEQEKEGLVSSEKSIA